MNDEQMMEESRRLANKCNLPTLKKNKKSRPLFTGRQLGKAARFAVLCLLPYPRPVLELVSNSLLQVQVHAPGA